jgi:hypothetical protein
MKKLLFILLIAGLAGCDKAENDYGCSICYSVTTIQYSGDKTGTDTNYWDYYEEDQATCLETNEEFETKINDQLTTSTRLNSGMHSETDLATFEVIQWYEAHTYTLECVHE